MLEGIYQGENYNASKAWLDVAAERHKVLAGNLANAETPGYQRLEIDPGFEEALRARLRTGKASTFSAEEVRFRPEAGLNPTSPDGNNVSTEQELMKINENALRYEMFGQFVSNSLRQLRTAITGKNT